MHSGGSASRVRALFKNYMSPRWASHLKWKRAVAKRVQKKLRQLGKKLISTQIQEGSN